MILYAINEDLSYYPSLDSLGGSINNIHVILLPRYRRNFFFFF